MTQGSLFPKEARARKVSARGAQYEAENLFIARQALSDPDRYGWLQAWAVVVLRNAGLREVA